MRILLCNRPGGAFGYITDGWQNALRDRGHEVRRWDGLENSWYEFQPHLYIGCSGHKQPILLNRGSCKVAIHVNPYGPVNIDSINESNENIKWVLNHRPDVVFGYGHEEDRILWSYWTSKHNIPWAPLPCAADRTIFHDYIAPSERKFGAIYLGGYWKYKGRTIDEYLIPALKNLSDNNITYSVHGWGDWPNSICNGILSEDRSNEFINNGLVGPCIAERHTHQYGIDIPERAFKLALAGTLPIHDPIPMIRRLIPSIIVAQDQSNFIDLCKHYCQNENERIEKVEQIKKEVLASNTYHHRMQTLFYALGFELEAKEMV